MSGRHYRQTANASAIPYHVVRGDQLLQDLIIAPETVRRGLDILSRQYGGGELAYTPEMVARFETVLQRRFETNDGTDNFEVPNYGVYEDADMAAFYGCDTSETNNLRMRRETFDEVVERLLHETAREINTEMAGLSQMQDHYIQEEWARYGTFDPKPYVHDDPNVTLFRNPDGGWCTIDRPAATSEKSNVIDLTQAVPDFTFASPHEGWLVDQRGRFYDELATDTPPAYGF